MAELQGGDNLGLIATRQGLDEFTHVFIARSMIEYKAGSHHRNSQVFPLFTQQDAGSLLEEVDESPNFSPLFVKRLSVALDLPSSPPHDLPEGVKPQDVLHYAYAVLHSPGYRSRYAAFLKIDFPRLPLPSNLELFRELAQRGGALVALHLVEAPEQTSLSARYYDAANEWRFKAGKKHSLPISLSFAGPEKPVVKKVGWSNGSVWLDFVKPKKADGNATVRGTVGFEGEPEAVWNFRIGGYQVCQKWLKDRGPKKGQPGQTLTAEDIVHYHRIVVALSETIRIMREIDEVIDAHGGWPGAFKADKAFTPTTAT